MRNGSTRVLGIILFALIGASALILGIMSTGRGISTPLKADLAATARFDEAVGGGNASTATDTLKNKDTDSDGVSDYDELNLYRTSPYIKDSDSDGVSDGDELNKGTDPNCPEGKDCGIQTGTDPSSAAPDLGPSGIPSGTIPRATLGDAASIRALLKEQGLTDELLNSIDDKELIDMYNESTKVVGGTQQ